MSERKLLEPYNGKREGVLFIGRWEGLEGKNPVAYVEAMKECKLPCRVMTSEKGVKKFEDAFKEAGITDYVIKAGITGNEKVDFIKGSRVFYMPSKNENYPFAFLECLGHMPCVVLSNYDWSDNFDGKYFHKVKQSKVAETITKLYETVQSNEALEYVRQLDNEVAENWVKLVHDFNAKRSNTDKAKINTYDTVKYSDYIKDLNRTQLAREDFESVLSNKKKYINIVYTDSDTYLSKDPKFVPMEEVTAEGLFENL